MYSFIYIVYIIIYIRAREFFIGGFSTFYILYTYIFAFSSMAISCHPGKVKA